MIAIEHPRPDRDERRLTDPGIELDSLRRRLAELRGSIEALGRTGSWSPDAPGGSEPEPESEPEPGESSSEPATGPARLATLDVGPFADLLELRRFEERLAELSIIRGLRVRRVGHGRAEIVVAVSEPAHLTAELQRAGRVEAAPDGRLRVELAR